MAPATDLRTETRTTRVMGTTASVTVVGGPPGLGESAVRHLHHLERRWSRFRPDSELCRLNAGAGSENLVSPETFTLVVHLCSAWRLTGGRFDPTTLGALRSLGYDRSFEDLGTRGVIATPRPVPAPGCGRVQLDARLGSVALPPGMELDAGGLGKGLAADLVATALIDAGAAGAGVEVGGDLRVVGEAPDPGGWGVSRQNGRRTLTLRDGGLATSGTGVRRWPTTSGTAHHLIDPRTGTNPADAPDLVTVVAGTAWWAEALATALMVDDRPGIDGTAAAWVHRSGGTRRLGNTEAFE